MANKLYVGNLSFDTTEEDLTELFAQAGSVERTELISDNMTGRSRGFAFVTMADEQSARAAESQFNTYNFHGRNLTVNEAKDREPNRGGGGGGGSRGGYGGGGGGGGGGRSSGGGGYGGGGGGGGGYGGGGGGGDRDRRPARR